jgi:hypothetical protein
MDTVRRLIFGVLVVLFSAAMTATAQTPPPSGSVHVTASAISAVGATPTGVATRGTLEAVFSGTGANGVRNYNVPVHVSNGTLGSLARGAISRGLGIFGWASLFRDLVRAAGWAIDELGKQVTTMPDAQPIPPNGRYWQDSPTARFWSSSSAAGNGIAAYYNSVNGADGYQYTYQGLGTCTTPTPSGPNEGTYSCQTVINVVRNGANLGTINPSVSYLVNHTGQVIIPVDAQPVPISDEDLGRELAKASPHLINGLLTDPVTGAPHLTPELVGAINALRQQLEAANNLVPGVNVVAPTNPAATGTNSSTAWPSFCSWAKVVCDWIDWSKEPPGQSDQPDDPWDDSAPPEPQQWSSGITGGTCPAPVGFTVTLPGGSASPSFSYDPLCQFAVRLRPVSIAIATLYAAYIIAGLRSARSV